MSVSRSPSRWLASTMGAAIALGAMPSGMAASGAGPGRVGTVHFDRAHDGLAIPVTGGAPQVHVRRLAPRQYVADLANCVLEQPEVQGERLHGPYLAGWSLDELPSGHVVRLRLTTTDDARPAIEVSRKAGSLWVHFDGPLARRNDPMAAHLAALSRHAAVAPSTGLLARATHFLQAHRPHWFPHSYDPEPAVQPGSAQRARAAAPRLRAALPPRAPAAARPGYHVPATPLVLLAGAPAHAPASPATAHHHSYHVPSQPLVLLGAGLAARAGQPRAIARSLAAARPAFRVGHAALGVPRYDAGRQLLAVPMSAAFAGGSLRAVQLNRRWAYLDIVGTHPAFSGVRYGLVGRRVLDRWVMAKRPGREATRISFALNGPADVASRVVGRTLLISVQPRTTMLGRGPKPAGGTQLAARRTPAGARTRGLRVALGGAPHVRRHALPSRVRVAASLPFRAPRPMATVRHASLAPDALATAPRGAARAQPAGATLDRPYFDEGRYGLVVPFRGRSPLYRWVQQGDRGATIEVQGTLASASQLLQRFRHHPLMASWKVERRDEAGTVRIALTFNRAAELVVAADAVHHQLLLIPQPRSLAAADQTAQDPASRTVLSAARQAPDGQQIVIPYAGAVPTYSVSQVTASYACINFTGSSLDREGVNFYAPDYHPSLNYWLLSQRPAHATVRLALALTQPGGAAVYVDPARHRLVVVLGGRVPQARAGTNSGPQQPGVWSGSLPRPAAARPAAPAADPVRRAS